jgi:hypothetical protein
VFGISCGVGRRYGCWGLSNGGTVWKVHGRLGVFGGRFV